MYHTAAFCVARNSQILTVNMGRRSGLLTELHLGGLRCHGCTVSNQSDEGDALGESGSGFRTANQGPRTDGPNENVCDLGGGASKVASQMLTENRLRKDASSSASEQGLITLVRSMKIMEDEPLIGARVPSEYVEGARRDGLSDV